MTSDNYLIENDIFFPIWGKRIYWFLTVIAFSILYFFTALIVISLMPFLFFKMKKTVTFILRFWARTVFSLIGRKLHIKGKENIKKNEKYILISNHASLFDIAAIMAFFPGIAWFGREKLIRIPLFGKVLKLTDYIPMKSSSYRHTKEMINQLTEKSKEHTIAIFPEGTRTLTGKINDFYRGFVILLRCAEIDVLPVTLNGFYKLKPKNRFYIGFNSRLDVIIHEPIPRNELINKNDSEIIDIVKRRIESGLVLQ
jgi:1-acyl-sn-glycerol-3-phosphate acyltransferase